MPPENYHSNPQKPGGSSGGIIQPIAMLEVAQTGEPAGGEVTRLLLAWSNGDRTALDSLTTVVYDELHRLASRYMKGERPSHTMQTTALVNEAYMRLVDYKRMQWRDRAHFFAVSAQVMRRILVEHARQHNWKRGGRARHVSIEEVAVVGGGRAADLVALDDAMQALAQFDTRKAHVVELRFFGGLTTEEAAEVLKVSPVTVLRDWSTARAWLYREMTRRDDNAPEAMDRNR
jgi:RNA polymerase sigma-70 factor (ECF subfamily)